MERSFFVSTHPLVAHKLAQMRNVTLPMGEFKRLIREMGMLMAYEVTADLAPEEVAIDTGRGTAEAREFKGDFPVIVPVLRSGLTMAEGVQEVLSRSIVGHIGIHRTKSKPEAIEYFVGVPPPSSNNSIYIIVDPVIATGLTITSAIDTVCAHGVRHSNIRIVSVLASNSARNILEKNYSDVRFFCAAVDNGNSDDGSEHGGLNALGQVVPGIGSVSQRLFGFRAVEE